jgi:hypothetical protein
LSTKSIIIITAKKSEKKKVYWIGLDAMMRFD